MSAEPEDLRTRTLRFALRIVRMVSSLPKRSEASVLGQQILRSGTSVGANWREADRARSKAEFIAKSGDRLREIDETEYWLELIVASGFTTAEKMRPLLEETRELIAILTTINKNAKR